MQNNQITQEQTQHKSFCGTSLHHSTSCLLQTFTRHFVTVTQDKTLRHYKRLPLLHAIECNSPEHRTQGFIQRGYLISSYGRHHTASHTDTSSTHQPDTPGTPGCSHTVSVIEAFTHCARALLWDLLGDMIQSGLRFAFVQICSTFNM